jgi:hypothetical protein
MKQWSPASDGAEIVPRRSSTFRRDGIMGLARRALVGVLGLIAVAGWALSQAPGPMSKQPKEPKEPDTTAEDLKTLRDVGIAADGPALLDYFRKRTLPMGDPAKIKALILQLGDDDFATREQASASLAALGAATTPELKKFEENPDTELRKRVLELKHRIEAKAEPAVLSAAGRMIARTKPAGAAEVLLAYIPLAVDPSVVNELCKALGAATVADGKIDPVVLKALGDSAPIKRGAAAEALIRAGAEAQLPAARALLKDADPQVRLRVALALVPRRDKEVLPVLIDLLAELPPDQLWPAEEILVRLAGDKSPPVSLGTNDATRKATRDAWHKWYTEHQKNIDLAKLEQPEALLGYTALVMQTINRPVVGKPFKGVTYEVMELKPDRSVRWKFDTNAQVVDVQIVGENRVLLAEYQRSSISERDFKGNIVWEKHVGGNPISVQRLRNGHTFVVKNNGVAEFDQKGSEVYSYQHGQFNVVRGKKLPGGDVVFISNNGNVGVCTRLDSKSNKIVKSFNINPVHSLFGSMDVLPGGGVLVPDLQRQRVVEYDRDGKEVKSFNVPWPLGAIRLPNDHTLVTVQNPGRVIELDRKGAEVWSHQCDGNVFNAKRR